jgi:hypothetical protein
MGITLESVVYKKLVPLMEFQETKFAQHKGKFTEYVNVDNGPIQLRATNTLLRLMNAFPPEDPAIAAKIAVEKIIVDMPRPDWPELDLKPIPTGTTKELTSGSNGKSATPPPVKDPRPKDGGGHDRQG